MWRAATLRPAEFAAYGKQSFLPGNSKQRNTRTMADDFLARERELLGDTFGSSEGGGNLGDIDFDRAASAFPDISLDGGEIPPPPVLAQRSSGGFDFDTFTSPPPPTAIKVTGNDDEIGKFESAFPDIGTTVSLTFFLKFFLSF